MIVEVKSLAETTAFGKALARSLVSGVPIELVGDVGAGKTSLTKGLALGLGITESVQSPTFTISRQYQVEEGGFDGSIKNLVHYDFYRLNDAGIMSLEIQESINEGGNLVIIEWGEIIADVLPADHLRIVITSVSNDVRKFDITSGGKKSQSCLERIL